MGFEAKLNVDEEGRATWVCVDLGGEGDDAEELEQVLKLSEQGLSIRKIETELGISKSKVHRLVKKAMRLKKEAEKRSTDKQ